VVDIPDGQELPTVTVKVDEFPDHRVTVWFNEAGVPVSMMVEAVRPATPADAKPVTARLLRRLPIGEIQAFARQAYVARIRSWADLHVAAQQDVDAEVRKLPPAISALLEGDPAKREAADRWEQQTRASADRWESVFEGNLRPGRRGRSDGDYARLAVEYERLIDAGTPHAVRALATHLALSPSQVRSLLYEARRRGLLTSSPAGQQGGRATTRAHELIEEGT
jgi:hypothetical protein